MKVRNKIKKLQIKTIFHTKNINDIIDNFLEDCFWINFEDVKLLLLSEIDNLNNSKQQR